MDEMQARQAYFDAFGNEGPRPVGVMDDYLARELQAAVKRGQPIPDDFDWYPDLPDGAAV
jgi:hypothetical protein